MERALAECVRKMLRCVAGPGFNLVGSGFILLSEACVLVGVHTAEVVEGAWQGQAVPALCKACVLAIAVVAKGRPG